MTFEALPDARLRVLHLVLVLGPTNSQYNEHCLPQMVERRLAICTYFRPLLDAPAEITVYPGDGTLRGFFRALDRALGADEYDVIHAHAAQSGLLLTLGLFARPRRYRMFARTVYTVHDSWYDFRPRNKVLMLPALALFRRVVFCGHAAFESAPRAIRALIGGRARVVQNAADLDRVDRVLSQSHTERTDDRYTVLGIGRLEPVKDPMTLIGAFERGADDESRLVLIGHGTLGEEVARRAGGSRLGDQIELTGLVPRDEVFRRCSQADVLVSTSHGEGLPVAAMEAMAAGCPVILSDIPPHRELTEGLDGVPLVEPGDVEGFAREIRRIRQMSCDERVELGRRRREHVHARFTIARMHAGYDDVYRELRPARAFEVAR